jgi:hypothetical protein
MTNYETWAEAGAAIKAKNPGLTRSDGEVGRWYEQKYRGTDKAISVDQPLTMVTETDDPSSIGGGITSAVTTIADAIPDIPSPFDAAGLIPSPFDVAESIPSPFEDVIYPAQDMMEAGSAGVASGISLGGTKKLTEFVGGGALRRQQQLQQEHPYTYGGGEILGELIGPLRAAEKAMGSAAATSALKKYTTSRIPGGQYLGESKRLRQALNLGAQGAGLEGAKAIVRGDNPVGGGWVANPMAIGFLSGAAPVGFARGVKGARNKAVEWWAKPSPGETDAKLVTFLKKWDIPQMGSFVAPYSKSAMYTLQRLGATALEKPTLKAFRSQLSNSLQEMQKRLSMKLGPNAALKSKRDVGLGTYDEIKNTRAALKERAANSYDDLRATDIGKVEIVPNEDFVRIMDAGDGEVIEEAGSIFSLLEKEIGHPNEALASGTRKKLRNWLDELIEQHKIVKKKRQPVEQPEWGPYQTEKKPTPPLGRDFMMEGELTPKYEQLNKDYNWWWGQLQEVGKMLDIPKVYKDPKLKAHVTKVYHIVQDGMDLKVIKEKGPDYEAGITKARTQWQDYLTYDDNATVKAITNLTPDGGGRANFEKVLPTIFNSTDGILDAKRILGPEGFNSLRQAWIRDLLLDSQLSMKGGEQFLSGQKLTTNLKKFTKEELDGDFIKEMFSDQNFFTPQGDLAQVNTHAAEKFALFRELYENAPKIEPAIVDLHGGAEQMQAMMTERFAPGELLTNPRTFMGRMQGLMANLLVLGKTGEIFFDQSPRTNPFLGGALRPTGLGPIGGNTMVRGGERLRRLLGPKREQVLSGLAPEPGAGGIPQELLGQLGISIGGQMQ